MPRDGQCAARHAERPKNALKTIQKQMRQEDALQSMCVSWFRLQYRDKMIFSFPAGYVFGGDARKRIITGARMKQMGYTNGTPDLFVPHPSQGFHGLFIEMKVKSERIVDGKKRTTKGQLSAAQKEVIKLLQKEGYQCAVCYDIKQFTETVKNYFK